MDDNWRLNLQEERKALLIRKEILTLEDNSYIGELEEIQGLEEAPKVFIDEKTSLRRKEIDYATFFL